MYCLLLVKSRVFECLMILLPNVDAIASLLTCEHGMVTTPYRMSSSLPK